MSDLRPKLDRRRLLAGTAAATSLLAAPGILRAQGGPLKVGVLLPRSGAQAGIGQEKEYTSFDTGWGYGPGYGGGWYGGGGGMSTGQTSTIYVGQLALDMYATSPKTLVWRGMATKEGINVQVKPEKRDQNITKAVQKIFKNYPPKVKS